MEEAVRLRDIQLANRDAEMMRVNVRPSRVDPRGALWPTALLQNYPSPFNPETWIPFELSEGSEVVVTVYNVRGQVVRSMELGFRDPGVYRTPNRAAYWDGRNDLGEEVAGDAYFVELSTGGYRETRRLALIK